ncbi:MAG: hypothetical protein ACRDOJ_00655 [Nocardioidaceae bacterium]
MRGRLAAGVVAVVLATSSTGCADQDTATPSPARGVCTDVDTCRVVASTDVDGDDIRDQVGFVVVSDKRVVVRVRTADGRTLRRSLATVWFPKGELFGASPIDGRPGAELVVGTTMGAHTLFFTSLTVRSGRLVRLPPPGPGREWMTDAAYSFHAGVTRRVEDGRVVVVLGQVGRVGLSRRFSGTDRMFVWRDGRWQHIRTQRTTYRNARAASKVGGWHVDGLPRSPDF